MVTSNPPKALLLDHAVDELSHRRIDHLLREELGGIGRVQGRHARLRRCCPFVPVQTTADPVPKRELLVGKGHSAEQRGHGRMGSCVHEEVWGAKFRTSLCPKTPHIIVSKRHQSASR